MPFLTHLVTTLAVASPMYGYVRDRCCTDLFLQGSALYDVYAIRDKLIPLEKALGFEMVIMNGKVQRFHVVQALALTRFKNSSVITTMLSRS
jgi:hypothetical protein